MRIAFASVFFAQNNEFHKKYKACLPPPCCDHPASPLPLPFFLCCCLPRPSCLVILSLGLFGASLLGLSGSTSPCPPLPGTAEARPFTPSSSPPCAATTAAPSTSSGFLSTSSSAALSVSLSAPLQQESLPSDSLLSSSYSAFQKQMQSTWTDSDRLSYHRHFCTVYQARSQGQYSTCHQQTTG